MKNKKSLILIVSAIAILLIVVGTLVIVFNNKEKYYRCETGIKLDNDIFVMTEGYNILYDKDKVSGLKTFTKFKYKDKKYYEEVLTSESNDKFNYKFDDKNLIFESIEKEYQVLKDEDGIVLDININDFISYLKEEGYTCKVN